MMDWLRRRIRNRAGARQDGVTGEAPVKPGFSPKAKQQLIILAICRFAEPVALTSVFPYLYFMLKSFDIPNKDIAFWVGVTAASFSFSQSTSGILWGRASDRYGRKPTILLGLLGTMLASILFGLSKSPLQAITARCLSGLLNGNVGILRTAVAEIVPEEHLRPRAFSLMPLIWAIGSIFGPVIGGYLADPVKNYPGYFSPGGFFSTYPYALPNFFNATLFIIGTTVGFLCLEEPLEARKYDRDIGRELGRKIVSLFSRTKKTSRRDSGGHDETTPLLTSNEENAIPPPLAKPIPRKHDNPPALREAFTRQSSMNIIVYAFLALMSVSFDQMFPVFLSFPPMDHYPDSKNPLKFFGGFGLSSREIGSMFSTFGFLAMFFQFFLYPPVARHYGSLRCLQISLVMYPLACFLSPFSVIVTEKYRRPFMYVLVFTKSFAGTFSFPSSTVLLSKSAPSLRVLGTLNGIATAVAALGRAIGPTITGTVFSYGQKVEYLILPFWFMSMLSLLSLIPSFWLTEGESPKTKDTIEGQESDPTSSPQSTLISENSTRSLSSTDRN